MPSDLASEFRMNKGQKEFLKRSIILITLVTLYQTKCISCHKLIHFICSLEKERYGSSVWCLGCDLEVKRDEQEELVTRKTGNYTSVCSSAAE